MSFVFLPSIISCFLNYNRILEKLKERTGGLWLKNSIRWLMSILPYLSIWLLADLFRRSILDTIFRCGNSKLAITDNAAMVPDKNFAPSTIN